MMVRRSFVAAGLAAVALPTRAWAEARPRLQIWRDENCGCCVGWVDHMRAAGFPIEDNVVRSVAAARRMLGTPSDLLSCHAGLVGGYALEGHVPAVAVTRLLAERPAGIRGLAVPGMPIGSSERDAYRIATGVIPKGRLISSSFFLTFEAFNNSRLRAALAASASAPWVFLESGACGGRGIYSPGLDHIALNARKFVNLSVVHQPR